MIDLLSSALHNRYNQPLWIGAFFVALYWCVESAVHCYFFDGKSFILDILSPDAHELWMRLIVIAVLITFSLYSHNAINRLKRAEKALIEQKREVLGVLEKNPAGIILVECATRKIAYANANATGLIGTRPEQLVGRQCQEFLCRADQGKCPVLDLGQQHDISERELRTADNRPISVLKSVSPIQYKGRPHLLEAFFDITEQKKMRMALQQAHAELDQIFQTATVGMRLIDNNFNILKINQTFSLLSGIATDEAVGRKCYEVFAGNMCHTADCSMRRVLAGEELADYEVTKVRSDGSVLICSLTVTPFAQTDGNIGLVESFKDISELKKVHIAVQSERDRLYNILFHQFESVGIITDHYLVEFQNELLKEQTTGQANWYCFQIFMNRSSPCDNCCMQQSFSSETVQRFEFDSHDGRSYQHTYTPFIDNDGHWKAVISRREITEEKASKAAALNAERLAALGELAAGVAHEINNPINGIINYAQILVNKTEPDNPFHEISNRIITEGDRIAAIVASLLSFARRDSENRSLLDLGDLLNDSLILAGTQLRKNGITLAVAIDDGLPPVLAAGQQLQQVFMNIISNSRYALNEKYPEGHEKKRLTIEIGLFQENDELFIRSCFIDSGVGIAPELIDKIVNPFFSTKPRSKGTGLGLSISHQIIQSHGGVLAIASVPDEYTKVTIDLPVCPAAMMSDLYRPLFMPPGIIGSADTSQIDTVLPFPEGIRS